MHQPADSSRHMDEGDADRCRRSLREEQARSLAVTDGWDSMVPGPKVTGLRS